MPDKFQGELMSKDVTLNAQVKMPDGQTAQKTLVVTIQRVAGTLDGQQREGRRSSRGFRARNGPASSSCQLPVQGQLRAGSWNWQLLDNARTCLRPAPASRTSLAASSSHRRETHDELHVVVELFDAEHRAHAELAVPDLAAGRRAAAGRTGLRCA